METEKQKELFPGSDMKLRPLPELSSQVSGHVLQGKRGAERREERE